MEQLFSLLQASPVLSIVLIFVLVMFLSYVFKDTIVKILKKRFNLYDEQEIRSAGIMTSNLETKPLEEKELLIGYNEKVIGNLKELKK